MDIIQSTVIGIIQGVTEFLPISSSGHLVIVPWIFGWNYQGLTFDVALHFGTVLAILCFFWKDWLAIFGNAFGRKMESKYPKNVLWQIALASIPAAIVGFLINDSVEEKLHSPLLISANLVIFGLLLWLADRKAKSSTNVGEFKYWQSFVIGVAQTFALIPGVSRSGATMTSARFLGLNRENAARFSFILGTPAMVGAFVFKAKDLPFSDITLPFLVGVAAAAIAGFLAIKYLLNFLKTSSFALFAWYRVALALVILSFYLLRQ